MVQKHSISMNDISIFACEDVIFILHVEDIFHVYSLNTEQGLKSIDQVCVW